MIDLKDEDGRFLTGNTMAAAVAGRSKAELPGKTDSGFYSREDADSSRAQERAVAQAGKPVTFRIKVAAGKGELTFIDH